ncbi:Various polyols ABC transporter, permease component 2, partial [Pseudomonas fluorescens]
DSPTIPPLAKPVARHFGLGHRDRDLFPDPVDGDDQLQNRNRCVRYAATVHLHADAGELPAHQRAQRLLQFRLELSGDLLQRHGPVPVDCGACGLLDGVLRNPAHQRYAAVDALDQDAAARGRADADLLAGQKFRPARHAHCADRDLHADQPADRGLDGLHLLQGHPQRHPRSRPPRRCHAVAGNGPGAAADRQGRPRLDRVAVTDPVLERGVLVAEPDLVESRAADRIDRLVFQSRRFVLGQVVGGVDAGLCADFDLRLDQPKATGARPLVRCREM